MITECKKINSIASNDNLKSFLKETFFIDIETTGLSREYSDIISITVLLYEENCYKIHQIYCEYKIDEPEAIKYLKDLIIKKEYIVTYNGNSFDIPFLVSKYKKHDIDFNFDKFSKLDLYNWIKQLKSKINNIDNFKLKTVEKYFNINRADTLFGEDIITLYEAYKVEPRKEFSYLIMQHNYEDVFNLPILFNSIIELYDDVLYYDGMIIKINNEDFKIIKNTLVCKFNLITNKKNNYINTNMNFDLNVDFISQTMKLNIPIQFFNDNKIKEFYFVDNKEYKVKTYTAIEGIKRNLMPIKFNDKIFCNNIINLIKTILNTIF